MVFKDTLNKFCKSESYSAQTQPPLLFPLVYLLPLWLTLTLQYPGAQVDPAQVYHVSQDCKTVGSAVNAGRDVLKSNYTGAACFRLHSETV